MSYFFSPSENIAYQARLMTAYKDAGTLPDNLTEISEEMFQEYFIAMPPAGKYRAAGDDGLPAWADMAQPSKETLVMVAEQERHNRIDTALNSIAVVQLKLQAGRKLTTDETARLNAALDYIDLLNETDTSTAPDIEWPKTP